VVDSSAGTFFGTSLPLPLFMLRVFANHMKAAVPFYNFAMIADALDGTSYLHSAL
jgi:hypothetical protein